MFNVRLLPLCCRSVAALLPITCVYQRNSPLVSSELVALVVMVA